MKQNPAQMLSAPIPGESLTKAPGAMKFEQPPQFTDLEEASEHMMDQLANPRTTPMLVGALKRGAPVEVLTKGVIFKGFVEGKWTPDLGLLLAKRVFSSIAAIGKRAGVKDLILWDEDTKKDKYFAGFSDMVNKDSMKADTEEPEVSPEADTGKIQFGGILGAISGGDK